MMATITDDQPLPAIVVAVNRAVQHAFADQSHFDTDPTVDEMIAAWHSVSANDYWAAVMDHQSPVDFFHSLSLQ